MALNPEVRRRVQYLRSLAKRFGITTVQTSGFRSIASQKRLYARFRAGRSRFPAAPPGFSTHNYGFAVDLVPTRGSVALLGQLAPYAGLVWAGQNDRVHFDPFGNRVWRQILREAGLRV